MQGRENRGYRHYQVQVQISQVRPEEPSLVEALQGPVRQVQELHRHKESLLQPRDRLGSPQERHPSHHWNLQLNDLTELGSRVCQ